MTCRKAHAAAFNAFLVFDPSVVEIAGAIAMWESSPGYRRAFCPTCGSRVFAVNTGVDGMSEYEISLGSYDETGWFTPQYESWIQRREPRLAPIDGPQFEANRCGMSA